MATGFDALAQAGVQNAERQQAEKEQQRIQGRNAQAALYEQALQNPDLGPDDRKAILQQHAALFQPHEAPSLFARLGGLIHGQTQKAAAAQAPQPVPAQDAQPAAAPAPIVKDPLGIPYSDPDQAAAAQQPMHPMSTDHPNLGRFREALDALGNHLKGFQQPVVTPPINPAADDVLARTYKSGPQINAEIASGARKETAQNALDLEAERRKRFMLTMTPENRYLAKYAEEHGYNSASEIPVPEQEEALQSFKKANTGLKLTTAIVVDPDSKTGFSKVTMDQLSGEVKSTIPGITPPRGLVPTQRVNRTADPSTGLTTTSVATTTPQVPGINTPGRPVSSKAPVNVLPSPNPNTIPSGPDAAAMSAGAQADQAGLGAINNQIQANKGKAGAPSRKAARVAPVSSNAPQIPGEPGAKQLDANGQIPANAAATPQIREAAQQLLDDRDVDKIPGKLRELAASVARQYGWEQGKFTPREQGQVRTAVSFLKQMQSSPSLSVLDNPLERYNIAKVLDEHTGPAARVAASQLLSPAAKEFIRNYNIGISTVQGLSTLIRNNRPTDTGIKRIIAEYPNVLQSSDSNDAKERIKNLLKEVDVSQLTTRQAKDSASSEKKDNRPAGVPKDYVLKDGPKGYGYYKP